MIKVYPISQLRRDLADRYSLSPIEMDDLCKSVTVSIFSGQINLYNCRGLIMYPRPTYVTWEAKDNPLHISNHEINKLLSTLLPTYHWNPQRQIPGRGRPLSGKSIEALYNSGELRVEAHKVANTFKNNKKIIPTRLEVAKGLVRDVYKDYNFTATTLENSLRMGWWSK